MAKFLSAVCTALLISLIATINSYTPAIERLENVYYDSFIHLFVIGLLILLALYILIAIPLTMLIDSMIAASFRTRPSVRLWVTLAAYCAAFSVLVLLFIAFSPMDLKPGMIRGSLWISALSVIPFVGFQQLFKWFGRKMTRL
ncbi:hypothetical protein PCCS19_36580 [Paenibacillus sp. CCS19]|uniref:hypothetical protein n=1 Tax=Paenibacillus sp. CCS19 TaxID=3158387 RepID=UPI002561C566|nr:hypothetical protein [Paenibacillus cellulosilyticus]GMK40602.1 hypothetical protein PCCS19_36580 [Paenibacillus cellulosilyticus]